SFARSAKGLCCRTNERSRFAADHCGGGDSDCCDCRGPLIAGENRNELVLRGRRQPVLIAAFVAAVSASAVFAVVASGAAGFWLDVPYVHQEKDGCGSASLAMVLRYWQTKNVA